MKTFPQNSRSIVDYGVTKCLLYLCPRSLLIFKLARSTREGTLNQNAEDSELFISLPSSIPTLNFYSNENIYVLSNIRSITLRRNNFLDLIYWKSSQTTRHMKWCRETLKIFDERRFPYVNNIVTGDKTWIYYFDDQDLKQSFDLCRWGYIPSCQKITIFKEKNDSFIFQIVWNCAVSHIGHEENRHR